MVIWKEKQRGMVSRWRDREGGVCQGRHMALTQGHEGLDGQ